MSTYRERLRDVSGLWWLTLGLGVLSAIAGIVVLARPGDSLATIAAITGIFVVIDGIVAVVAALSRSTESRGLAALIGVLNLVIGILLIRHPIGGVVAIALFVGIWLIAMGAIRLVLAFDADRAPSLAVSDRGGRGRCRDRDRVKPTDWRGHPGAARRPRVDRQRRELRGPRLHASQRRSGRPRTRAAQASHRRLNDAPVGPAESEESPADWRLRPPPILARSTTTGQLTAARIDHEPCLGPVAGVP
jgi:hypothetical protein